MSEWQQVRLGDIAPFQYGKGLVQEKRNSAGDIPVYGSSGIAGYHTEAVTSAPSIIIGRKGTVGSIYLSTIPCWPIDTTFFTYGSHSVDLSFLYYAMQTLGLQHMNSDSAVPGLNRDRAHSLMLTLPPLPEQRAIAEILGSLDDKIEANRRQNETLEATARAIFKSWFVDFDPVHAKARGERPAGMDAETAALFPDSFEDSALGLIPRGWQVGRLDEFCKIARGSSPRPINDYMNGTTPWVKIADATAANGPFIFETKEKLKESGVSKSVFLKRGSLILSNSATAGIPIFLEIDGCIHDGWLYFPDLTSFSQNYLYHVLLTISNHLISIADGTVQKNLNTKLVGSQFILLPTDDLLAKFDEITVSLINKVKSNSIESRTLAETRDVLLPRLVSGELRVGDVGDIS